MISTTDRRGRVRDLATAARALLDSPLLPPWPARAEDLARIGATLERLDRRFTLAVVGEFSSGKSYLLNALLGKVRRDNGKINGLLTVDINPSTATITELEYAPDESALARYPSGRTERVPLDQLGRFVAVGGDGPGALHDATADEDAAPTHVTVRVDSPFLQGGFVVADTPGLASLNPAHRRVTLSYLPRVDAVLYLIDTQQPFTDGDAAFLSLIGEHVRAIFIVQTKIDLWRMPEGNGQEAWENARDRIVAHAARHAPAARVLPVSSHEFALAQIENDVELRERSGFPALLDALDRSLEELVEHTRIARTGEIVGDILARATERLDRERSLITMPATALSERREQLEASLAEREQALELERDAISDDGGAQAQHVLTRGAALGDELVQALSSAFDVADIERLRDRGKLHALIDAVAARSFERFAEETALEIAAALERIAQARPNLRVAEAAALRLGGEPGSGAWAGDLRRGIRSTIVLGAVGGPTLAFVHAVASAFAAQPHGRYMKRELGIDARERFFPQLRGDLALFVQDLAAHVAGIFADTATMVETERRSLRGDLLDPVDRAQALLAAGDSRAETLANMETARRELDALRAALAEAAPPNSSEEAGPQAPALHARENAGSVPFDADVYQSGLRPERFRVVVLGALRRGKSSLINAIAGTQLLQDEGNSEAVFPIHVRFGEQERAHALVREGKWHDIPFDAVKAQATGSPVLIEIPWNMPRELVLVHAPAFDSGNENAEEIALAACGAASEILMLFSRQLSDRELQIAARVAELGKPMLFAHTIADHESAQERRTVVELARRYLAERDIHAARVFTVSALEYREAAQAERAPAAWNELGALRETLASHAEEHMQRLERLRRQSATLHERETAPPKHERSVHDRLLSFLKRPWKG